MKLQVKKKNNVSMERSDLKSPTNRPQPLPKPIEIREELESLTSKQTRGKRPLQSADAMDIDSRFPLQED